MAKQKIKRGDEYLGNTVRNLISELADTARRIVNEETYMNRLALEDINKRLLVVEAKLEG